MAMWGVNAQVSVTQYHAQGSSAQALQGFSSLEEMPRKNHKDISSAAATEQFVRAAIHNLSVNPACKGIESFFKRVEPWRSARYLVLALRDGDKAEPVSRVLAHYGPSEHTVPPLVGSIGDSRAAPRARCVLVGYGLGALDFIRPDTGNHLYRQVMEVRTAILAAAGGKR